MIFAESCGQCFQDDRIPQAATPGVSPLRHRTISPEQGRGLEVERRFDTHHPVERSGAKILGERGDDRLPDRRHVDDVYFTHVTTAAQTADADHIVESLPDPAHGHVGVRREPDRAGRLAGIGPHRRHQGGK